MAKKKTSQQPAPVKDKPQAPAQDQARTAAPARVTTVSLTTCLVSVVVALALGLCIGSMLPGFMDSRQAPAPRPQAAAPAQQPAQQQAAPQQQAKASLSPELNSALLKLQEAVVKEPNKAENWIKLGNFQFDNQNPSAAVTAYENALRLKPGNANVLTDLGIMYRELHRFEDALKAFREAERVQPGHRNALFNQGIVLYYDLKRKDEAEAAWRKLLSNVGANPITALTLRRLDVFDAPEVRDLGAALLDEALAVARAEGAALTRSDVDAVVSGFTSDFPRENGSSMLYDRLAGLPTEHEHIPGAVVRAARRHGIPVPRNETVLALMRGLRPTRLPASVAELRPSCASNPPKP